MIMDGARKKKEQLYKYVCNHWDENNKSNINLIPVYTMIAYSLKRKPLSDCTNVENDNHTQSKKHSLFAIGDMMPHTSPVKTNHGVEEVKTMYLQNVHPMLALYKNDLVTDHMSFDTFF